NVDNQNSPPKRRRTSRLSPKMSGFNISETSSFHPYQTEDDDVVSAGKFT
ncbi:hypothetical protein TNCT_729781, partial [Trichonephila clavata]